MINILTLKSCNAYLSSFHVGGLKRVFNKDIPQQNDFKLGNINSHTRHTLFRPNIIPLKTFPRPSLSFAHALAACGLVNMVKKANKVLLEKG